ncbi:acyl-CoA dehydrogenase family protein [Membranihabitans marinus]|uniref:acyl-CoA dehydrogenase family protein n=1 Tax=Membranihabitans marinus TaxID=1227546 RepID=UPI001F20E323|nr:acyl-CoA dehydrogenase family protein [Membranihabitans marinus]
MNTTSQQLDRINGGDFIVNQEDTNVLFFPEFASEEQLLIVESLSNYIDSKIKPKLKLIEKGEFYHSVNILEEMGEMGFLGIHMPEQFGGMEMDENTDILVNELFGPLHSFNVSYSVQVGIGMLPILYFGSPAQKQHYLSKIISGEMKSAYCLTEPTSGSDALSAKTKAVLSEDGKHYVLNGQKMWISNSGFADVFIVFAQVDGKHFTGFIVDGHTDGITLGNEEDKMGIHGSSTRQVFFENVKVPVENVLGEIGQGHKIAFNVLNIGRLKLSVLCVAGSKNLNNLSIQYANDRKQFNTPISNFGAIKNKIAEQVIRTFAGESAIYRTSSALNAMAESLKSSGVSYGDAKLQAAQEYAIECAILKVYGSEVIDFVVDEAVQIHGGMGFSEESEVSMAYRNARINRIFEGTNEINRLLCINMLVKNIQKGDINLGAGIEKLTQSLTQTTDNSASLPHLKEEFNGVQSFKNQLMLLITALFKEQQEGRFDLNDSQEVVMNLADILIDIYVAESLALRVYKLKSSGIDTVAGLQESILKVFLHDAKFRIVKNAIDAAASVFTEETFKDIHQKIVRLDSYSIQNVLSLRRQIADKAIELNHYPM